MYSDYFREPTFDSSLEEKISIIKENSTKSKEIKRELRNLQTKVSSTPMFSETNSSNDTSKVYSTTSLLDRDTLVDSLYNSISLLDISSLNENEVIEKISGILNENKLNTNIISKIKLMLYKEYILYSKMTFDSMSSEELKDLEEILKTLNIKISLLDDLEEEEDLTTNQLDDINNQSNNIFFLESGTGNVIVLENLRRKSIPREYYPVFKNLLMGLKNGKLRGVKYLSRHGYYELKDFKVRVTFDKLSNGNYIVIDAFMKKFDTSGYYRKTLDLRTAQYLNMRDYYLSKLQDEKFVSEHEGYYNDILTLLDSKLDEEDVSYAKRLS